MEFKDYSEIENHYNNKVINNIIQRCPEVIEMDFQITEKLDGCLDGNTLIETKEYGTVPISFIVDNKINCTVLSMDVMNGEKEWDEVINFSSKSNTNKQWYVVELEDGAYITITGNHKVWCPKKKEYVSVELLKEGDDFLLKR